MKLRWLRLAWLRAGVQYQVMSGKQPRVLVIDDYPQILRFVELCLRSRGYEVFTASSGEDAINLLGSHPPDVIVLDIRMPDMNGFQFMDRARELGSWPVIAYSATPEYGEQALRSGACAFLRKPLDLNQLTEELEQLTNGKR